MSATIHILTAIHNNLDNLKKLLTSIDSQTYSNYTITVVDDGSADQAHDYLEKNYPSVKYLRGNGKLWWTGSLNMGLKDILSYANESDYVLAINNDCTFGKKYLSNIVRHASSKVIIGSKIIDQTTGKTWDLGVIIDWKRGKILPRKSNSDQLDALVTKGTLYPISLFREISLLAKQLPHYISDYEFSIRAARRGYILKVCTDCIIRNDTKNTGFGDNLSDKLSYHQVMELLFARRSKINIIDHFWFITLSCPIQYKFQNYLRLLIKTIYLLVLPIPPLHRLLTSLKKSYNA